MVFNRTIIVFTRKIIGFNRKILVFNRMKLAQKEAVIVNGIARQSRRRELRLIGLQPTTENGGSNPPAP